jgi:hypothetical protein
MTVDRKRLSEELCRMRVLIEKDPEVKARFDTDGNGVIDGHEWEQVRQLVIQRLERADSEEAEGRACAKGVGATFGGGVAAPGEIATGIVDDDLVPTSAVPHGIGEADCRVLEQQGGPRGWPTTESTSSTPRGSTARAWSGSSPSWEGSSWSSRRVRAVR